MSQLEIMLENWRREVKKAHELDALNGVDNVGRSMHVDGLGYGYVIPGMGEPPQRNISVQ